jgi:hypothetical protein
MYENWIANATVAAATIAAVMACVLLHYEGLILTSGLVTRHRGHRRVKVLYGIGAVLALHIAEIWIFGLTYWLLMMWPDTGQAVGHASPSLLDTVYLSAMTFTTVGYGDIAPIGPVRFLAGTEALTGFVLITWSASFTYLEMERFWRRP